MNQEKINLQKAGFNCSKCNGPIYVDGLRLYCGNCTWEGFLNGAAFLENQIEPTLKTYEPIDLPEIKKPGFFLRLWAKINGHKATIMYGGMIVGGVLAVIPVTALLGKAIFAASLAGEGGALLHREGKKSKYGENGKFGWKNLWEALMSIFRVILNFIKGRRT